MNNKKYFSYLSYALKWSVLSFVILVFSCQHHISKPQVNQVVLDYHSFHGSLVSSTDTTMTWELDYLIVYHFENTGAKISGWSVEWGSIDSTCKMMHGVGMDVLGSPTDFLEQGIKDTISWRDIQFTFPCSVAPLNVRFSMEGYFVSHKDEPIDSLHRFYYHAHLDTLYP